jgi:hypothetical protein
VSALEHPGECNAVIAGKLDTEARLSVNGDLEHKRQRGACVRGSHGSRIPRASSRVATTAGDDTQTQSSMRTNEPQLAALRRPGTGVAPPAAMRINTAVTAIFMAAISVLSSCAGGGACPPGTGELLNLAGRDGGIVRCLCSYDRSCCTAPDGGECTGQP